MEFLPSEFIKCRKQGERVRREDLEKFIRGYVNGEVPDYQAAAWLMATCFNPLTAEETAWLTQVMVDSGKRLRFESPNGLSVDKHSTGGVGDKTTMILAPIVAAAGVRVPMMAGRGLGHTGGTLDKLEAIPGMSVRWDLDHFAQQVETVGLSIIGQTDEICPADRKMYSLRDVTATIDCVPLICASIMSKKIAEGCQALVLDVKFGSGAFMKTIKNAEMLARALMEIGTAAGLKVSAVLSSMDEPLGRFVGNALEIQECLEILRREDPRRPGKTWADTENISLDLAAQMLFLAGRCPSEHDAKKLAMDLLDSGAAYKKFEEMVRAQGGDLSQPLPISPYHRVIPSPKTGYVSFANVEKIGLGCIVLGAGRRVSSDVIDPGAGLEIFVENGQGVRAGDPLFKMIASSEDLFDKANEYFLSSFHIDDNPPASVPLIAKVLQ